MDVSAFLGDIWNTIGGFLNFARHGGDLGGLRFVSDVMNWNFYLMATIWLNVIEFCRHRYQFAILPFYKFAITIASPYLK